jgi:hypothetical protein
MHGKIFQAAVNHQAEDESENAKENTEEKEFVAVDAEELDLGEVGELKTGFAASFLNLVSEGSTGS